MKHVGLRLFGQGLRTMQITYEIVCKPEAVMQTWHRLRWFTDKTVTSLKHTHFNSRNLYTFEKRWDKKFSARAEVEIFVGINGGKTFRIIIEDSVNTIGEHRSILRCGLWQNWNWNRQQRKKEKSIFFIWDAGTAARLPRNECLLGNLPNHGCKNDWNEDQELVSENSLLEKPVTKQQVLESYQSNEKN